jgi:O-antigen ligase
VGAIAFLSALFLALYETKTARRILLLALVPLIGTCVVMSSTRSAWLGAYAGLLMMAALDQRRRTALLTSIAVLTIAGAAATAVLLPQDSMLEERASSVEPIRARLAMYDVGVRIAARRLLTGYGRGAPSRIAARTELYATSNADAAEFAPGQFHNIFLMTLVEWGVGGLIAYVALLVLIAKAAARLRHRFAQRSHLARHFAALFLATMVVFVTQGLFVDIPSLLYLNGVFFFLAGLVHAQLDASAPAAIEEPAAA